MPIAGLVGLLAILGLGIGWLLTRTVDRESGTGRFHVLVVLSTGALFAAATWRLGPTWELPAYLYFAALSVALALIDLQTHRLPNPLTLSAYPITVGLLALPAVIGNRYPDLGRALLAGLVLLAVFGVLNLVNPAGMGMGDVKLSGPMGAYLGWVSWSAVLTGAAAGFILGAIVGLGLMVLGRANRKSALPFGPFMLVGAWAAIVLS